MSLPKILLNGDQLALAAAMYVRDTFKIDMVKHHTVIRYDRLTNKFSAEVECINNV